MSRSTDDASTRLADATFSTLLEALDEGVIVFDDASRCVRIGDRAADIFGVDPSMQLGRTRAEVIETLGRAFENPERFDPQSMTPMELDVALPEPRRVIWTRVPILFEGEIRGELAVVRDVTAERHAEGARQSIQDRLDALSPIDPLTQVANARRFGEELEREHARSVRAWDGYGILRIDVDGMRGLNVAFGGSAGDDVLARVAACLSSNRRDYDLVARYADDEFAVLLPGADAVSLQAVADRFTRAIAAREFDVADGRAITVSIGGTIWSPRSTNGAAAVFLRAGDALSEARRGGAGDVVLDCDGDAKSERVLRAHIRGAKAAKAARH